ncbi:MAG: tetratricopeptide repeat protein, partial [Myxococcales bacterium]|nr:tetratricopeptide repeat protein [Myxococcales bacterium]
TCGKRERARACLSPGSRGGFEADGNLQLQEGSTRIEATGPIALLLTDVRVEVTTETADFRASQEVQDWSVLVESGTVTVTGPDGASRVIDAGESAGSEIDRQAAAADVDAGAVPTNDSEEATDVADTVGTSKIKEPTPSADELLALAREQRAAKDFAAAAKSYERMLRAYPSSPKVGATLVSLAQLYQGPLADQAKALTYFDRYLDRGGPLAEEAHYGKIRALRSLGRSAAAKTEVEAFLRSYPDSAYADALRGE